jgi:hypothetical protein
MDVCLCVSMLCCPVSVEAFATGWSLVLRSPTKCQNGLQKPPVWGDQGPYKGCRATDDDDDDILFPFGTQCTMNRHLEMLHIKWETSCWNVLRITFFSLCVVCYRNVIYWLSIQNTVVAAGGMLFMTTTLKDKGVSYYYIKGSS